MFRVTTRSVAGHNRETRHFGFTQLSYKGCDTSTHWNSASKFDHCICGFCKSSCERYDSLDQTGVKYIGRKSLERCVKLSKTTLNRIKVFLILSPCDVNFGIKAGNNLGYVKLEGFKNDEIKTMDIDRNNIEVAWSNRLDEDVIKTVASTKKFTVNLGERKEFITEWDMIEYLESALAGYEDDIVVTGKFVLRPGTGKYKDQVYREYQIQNVYMPGEKDVPHLDKVKLKPGTWFSLSRKMNGNRGTFYRGKFISRQGQEFTGLDHIKDDIIKELGDESLIDEYVYDGELVYRNSRGLSDGEAFRVGTGMLNSDGDKSQIKFVVFDLIPTDEFENGKGSLPYEDGSFVTPYKLRRKWLEDLAVTIEQKGLKNIQVVPMVYEGTDQSVIPQWLDYAVKHDWEGLMLNTSVPYKRARHTGCLKIKRFYTVDLRVTAIKEYSWYVKDESEDRPDDGWPWNPDEE